MINFESMQSIVQGFPKMTILPRKKGSRARADRRSYINIISSFDIETTRIPSIDNSVMYIWQWSFYDLNTDKFIYTVYGRTWGEYLTACQEIQMWIKSQNPSPEKPTYMVRLVHNLSYEFHFLSAFVKYEEKDVFILEKRKIARADSFNCIEDRCTYIHSNMSLSKYAQTWDCDHKKLSGIEFDYNIPRYPWTELTEDELQYCENDVLSVIEAYVKEMKHFNDTLYSVPLLPRGM